MSEQALSLLDADLSALLGAPLEAPADTLGAGDIVSATVTAANSAGLTLSLDSGLAATCAASSAAAPGFAPPAIGDRVHAVIETLSSTGATLSIAKAQSIAAFDRWAERAGGHAELEGTVQIVLRGGFGIEAEGTRLLLPYRESGIRNEAAHEAVGRTFRFEVTEFDPERAQIMIARRRVADAARTADRAAVLASLTEGAPVSGVVRSIVAFGAFVDIGGVDALLHISDASLEHVEDLNSLLRVGDHIEAVVRAVDVEKGKVSISRKSILETGAREKLAGFEPGAILSGTVSRFSDIFAFIALEDGVEGSVHVSEIAWGKRLQHPADELTEGQSVQVKVLSVDAGARRVKLSIKQTSADPLASFGDSVAEGALVTGTISRIEDYGLFVKLQEGLEGLCHISDLSWTARPDRPTDVAPFKIGDSLEVRVLSVDLAARRLKLGLKQVSADPWIEAGNLTQVGTLLKATVTRFDKDAAYLRIAPDLEGRMHISEVSLDRVDSIRSALRIGQEVECMVIKSEALRRRLDLSVKAVAAKAEAETPKSYADADMSMSPLAAALAKVTGE